MLLLQVAIIHRRDRLGQKKLLLQVQGMASSHCYYSVQRFMQRLAMTGKRRASCHFLLIVGHQYFFPP
jgi:hypothetical protein